MNKPFRPSRIVGGSVIAENEPFRFESTASYRAVEIVAEPSPEPYRAAGAERARRVVVREPHEHVASDEHFLELFQSTVAQSAALAGTAAPQVLHVFGRDGRAHALVEDAFAGVGCHEVVATLRTHRGQLRPEIAVAIAAELVGLWRVPEERGQRVAFHLGTDDLVITAEGRVRARPDLATDRARQVVGAMAAIIEGNIGYISPEQVNGRPISSASGMFTFGVILYELLVGEHPFGHGIPMMEVLSRIRSETLPAMSTRRRVPARLSAFLQRATAPAADARFASWGHLSAELDAVRAELPPVGPAELLQGIPLQPTEPPPLDATVLAGWRSLPHDGFVAMSAQRLAPAQPRTAARREVASEYHYPTGTDGRPMLAVGSMLVDAQPVSAAELARFAITTGRITMRAGDQADDVPATNMSYEDALAYAAWAGKRLPMESEWEAAVAAYGAERLGIGAVWEWTTTPDRDGRVVRGGRWRNAPERPPLPSNRSFETDRAHDVGFRCVR